MPLSQYKVLNEERDKLTELREENLSKRPEKPPSLGAKVSIFIDDHQPTPDDIGRPKRVDHYHVPISPFQAEFAEFKDIISGPLDPTLAPLTWRWSREFSGYFSVEAE